MEQRIEVLKQAEVSVPVAEVKHLLEHDTEIARFTIRNFVSGTRVNAGILTTAGQVLFTADASGHLLALDPTDGHVLWHTRPGGLVDDAAPMTYQLGRNPICRHRGG